MTVSELELGYRPAGHNGNIVLTARLDGEAVAVEELNISKSRQRDKFIEAVCRRYGGISREALEEQLLRIAAEVVSQCEQAPDKSADALDNQSVTLQWPEPWPEPLELADVLDEVREAIHRHVVLRPEAAAAIALWTAWTYVYDSGSIAPMLGVVSPSRRCGKTTLLTLLLHLAARPLPASNITPAAVYRVIEQYAPLTLVIDEVDTFTKGNDELRGIINSGHTRKMAYVLRNVPKPNGDYDARRFSTWCAKVIASIGNPHTTWSDRAITVRMERKHRSEMVERLTPQVGSNLQTLARKVFTAVVADEVKAAVASGDPVIPDSLHDRAADNWRPLLAIADLAGSHWPTTARQAAVILSGCEEPDNEDLGVRLLLDCLAVFNGDDELPARTLAERLAQLEETPWPTYRHGKPVSPEQVGRYLRRFGIKPRKTKSWNVYCRTDVEVAAARYSPPPPDQTSTTSTLDVTPCETSTYGVEVSETPTSIFHPTSTHLNPDATSTYGDGGSSGSKNPPVPEKIVEWRF